MKKIRLLLVDDEKAAREELSALLQQHPDFEIVASAPNGQEALTILEAGGIDALFLDIEMPLMTGLELANILGTWPNPPRVVFATAHNQYAVNAFEANAIDYVLKPYQEDRLAKALEKTQKLLNALENVIIPQYQQKIRFILATLEEREREEFAKLKKVKAKMVSRK